MSKSAWIYAKYTGTSPASYSFRSCYFYEGTKQAPVEADSCELFASGVPIQSSAEFDVDLDTPDSTRNFVVNSS
jgi:hypothetical protein